jgi:hypothetical protein
MASIKLQGDTSGEITISAPSVAGTTTLTLPATSSTLATQTSLGVRNLIINGNFNVWQRGTSFSPTSSLYGADRFLSIAGGGFNIDSTVTQSADVPTGQGFKYSLDIAVDTVQTPTGSNNGGFGQFCETQNFYHLAWGTSNAKSLTLSFWVKSNKTGIYVCQFKQNETGTNYYILKEYTINTADTWEKKIITIDGNTSQSFDGTVNGDGFRMMWWLASGPDDYATKDVWTAGGGFKATSNQVNFWDNAANYWRITGVQLEVGTEATPFEHRPYDMELARCQRYFQKLTPLSGNYSPFGIARGDGGTGLLAYLKYAATVRAAPTITVTGTAVNTPSLEWLAEGNTPEEAE